MSSSRLVTATDSFAKIPTSPSIGQGYTFLQPDDEEDRVARADLIMRSAHGH